MKGYRWAPILALAIAAGGCPRPRPSVPTHLTIGQLTPATTLDPHLQDDERTASTLDHFYNRLVAFNSDMQIVPELAVRWENLSDTVWRFHLRRGVVFHDGRPFGAEDVRRSIERAQTLPGSLVAYYVQPIREVRVLDDATVDVVTRDPSPVLLNRLVFIDIVPRGTGNAPITHPVGTGPYRFLSGAPGRRIDGERFPNFWGTPPPFQGVSIVPFADSESRATAVGRGSADVVGRFPEQYWRREPGRSVRLISRQGVSEAILGFSSGIAPFSDARVRAAVALSLDRQAIAARAFHGLAAPLDQLVPSTVFGHSSRLPPVPHDPAEARRLLAAAGFGGGFAAELLLPDYLHDLAVEVARELAPVGIRVRPVELPLAAFNDRWARADVPLVLFGWAAGTGDASDLLDALLHSRREGYGRWNHFAYSDPDMDRWIDLSDRTLDPATRLEYLTHAQEVLRRDWPIVPLVLRFDLYAVRRGLTWFPRADRRIRAFDFALAQPPG